MSSESVNEDSPAGNDEKSSVDAPTGVHSDSQQQDSEPPQQSSVDAATGVRSDSQQQDSEPSQQPIFTRTMERRRSVGPTGRRPSMGANLDLAPIDESGSAPAPEVEQGFQRMRRRSTAPHTLTPGSLQAHTFQTAGNGDVFFGINGSMDIQSVEDKLRARQSTYQQKGGSWLPSITAKMDEEASFYTAAERSSRSSHDRSHHFRSQQEVSRPKSKSNVAARRLSLESNVSELSSPDFHAQATEETTATTEKRTVNGRKDSELSEFCNDNLNLPHPSLEFPPLYFLLRRYPVLLEYFNKLYAIRWSVSYPLQRRIPASKFLRKMGIFFTYGELIMVLPFVAFFVFGTIRSFVDPSVSITGHASRTPLIFAFATGMRNSFLTLLIGIPFERALWYHKLAGRVAFVNAILHTYVAFVHPVPSSITGSILDSAWAEGNSNFIKFCFGDSVNVGGTLLFLAITTMVITSIPYIRRRIFELFFYVHVIFATACLGCAFYHTGILIPILGSLTWGLDVLCRKVYMAHFRYPKKGRLRHISDTVVELSFQKTKDFDYNPGQYVRLAVPDVSMFEWHPFSLSSCPLEDRVTICIRKAGTWTKALHKLAETKQDVRILLEGPYGSVGVDLTSTDRYKVIMLLSGGIGVTPMQSLCNQLVFEHATKRREIKKLGFYWMERDPTALQDMDVSSRGSSIHKSIRSLNLDDDDDEELLDDDHDSLISGDLSISQSILSDIEAGNPIDIASTLLAFVPPSKTTDEQLIQDYPSEALDKDEDNQIEPRNTQRSSNRSLLSYENFRNSWRKQSSKASIDFEIEVLNKATDKEELGTSRNTSTTDNDESRAPRAGDAESKTDESSLPQSASAEPANKIDAKGFRSTFAEQKNPEVVTPQDNDDPYGILDMNMFLTAKNEANKISGHPFVQIGRPDLVESFIQMKENAIALGEKRVAVCVCAPERLVTLCKKACVKYSDSQVRFDLHEEIFG